jgi:putative transposase
MPDPAVGIGSGEGEARDLPAQRQSPAPSRPPRPASPPQPRALSAAGRQLVLDNLHQERFWDAAPASVYATLLDEGRYLCSVSTLYRLLRERGETVGMPPTQRR